MMNYFKSIGIVFKIFMNIQVSSVSRDQGFEGIINSPSWLLLTIKDLFNCFPANPCPQYGV